MVLCLKQSKNLFGILRGEIQQDQQCASKQHLNATSIFSGIPCTFICHCSVYLLMHALFFYILLWLLAIHMNFFTFQFPETNANKRIGIFSLRLDLHSDPKLRIPFINSDKLKTIFQSVRSADLSNITFVSKKPGQTIVLYHYCSLSRFF